MLWLFCNAERSKRICPAFAVTDEAVHITAEEKVAPNGDRRY